ncbi:hypothetical protein IU500_01530 [Nocardia terpenica]|uniref:hypothetical protein n=1 Tax=Nocardia terpenica TaxID=455432 RepID=UPI001893231E|nr:hypothetical protein [Nocardia terpenica]MBF6059745.1 hypothetical protein [Nocardia terpenica]MBF6102714.1 hypothetical protein [Nocardia terpenica]MBF6111095.1 hypothetical protein [Nocardia terpenica]MBF6117226.1 hypothetical protein [Nocardia terpenica]MBF6150933.1 hypothetical protein [Nocardia terpenica]
MSADIGRMPRTGRSHARQFPLSALAWIGAPVALGVAIWVSTRVHVGPGWLEAALFVHLASVVVGLGAVLVADYFAALWVLRLGTLAEVIAGTQRLHLPIWLGMIGLVSSGMLLSPDLSADPTRLKLAFVFALLLNGLYARALGGRMAAAGTAVGTGLLVRGVLTSVVSQACWWGAVWIGFAAAQARSAIGRL